MKNSLFFAVANTVANTRHAVLSAIRPSSQRLQRQFLFPRGLPRARGGGYGGRGLKTAHGLALQFSTQRSMISNTDGCNKVDEVPGILQQATQQMSEGDELPEEGDIEKDAELSPMEEAISSPILQQAMHQMSEGKELLDKGNIAKGIQLLEEAISGLSEALARGSQSLYPCKTRAQVTGQVLAEARYLAGTSEQRQGNFARALLHFQSGVQECAGIVANIPAFYYGMATSQAVIGDLAGALENFRGYENAIKQGNFAFSPMQSMMLSFNIGQTLVRMQRSEEALAAFQLIFASSANDEIADEAPQESYQNKERGGLLKGKRNLVAAAHYWAGTQFTCFTRTKVQILTPEELQDVKVLLTLSIRTFTQKGQAAPLAGQAAGRSPSAFFFLKKKHVVHMCWRRH